MCNVVKVGKKFVYSIIEWPLPSRDFFVSNINYPKSSVGNGPIIFCHSKLHVNNSHLYVNKPKAMDLGWQTWYTAAANPIFNGKVNMSVRILFPFDLLPSLSFEPCTAHANTKKIREQSQFLMKHILRIH